MDAEKVMHLIAGLAETVDASSLGWRPDLHWPERLERHGRTYVRAGTFPPEWGLSHVWYETADGIHTIIVFRD